VFAGYKRKIKLVCLCVLTLSVAACGGNGGRLAADQQPPIENALQAPEYRLGEGDVIAVNVWKNPDLSVEVPVRPDGFISVPLVGDL